MIKSVAGLPLPRGQNLRDGEHGRWFLEAASGEQKGIIEANTPQTVTQQVPQATWPRPLCPGSQDNVGGGKEAEKH